MHANPEYVPPAGPPPFTLLSDSQGHGTVGKITLRFLDLLRLAMWRAFQHDLFAIAKASAYSSILTFFPTLLVVGAVLASSHKTEAYLREISYALGRIMPAGSYDAINYLKSSYTHKPIGLLVSAILLTLWTASGTIISWMEGFRRCYELPTTWGIVKERLIAFSLVILAGVPLTFATVFVAFGNRIEARILFLIGHVYGPYIFLLWMVIRWSIALLTSIAVISLIYHNAVPRTQRWHTVIPGATLATMMWFGATLAFGWYLQHYGDYDMLYGSFGVGVALMVWMYIVSLIILIGAEFNAMIYPRTTLGHELRAMPLPKLLSEKTQSR